jgi:colicin import membrane protein
MSTAAESILGRPDRMWPSVTVSLAVHALIIVWALARPAGPEIDLEQKPIVARLVRLGEKKPEEFLPRKEAPPEPPAPAPAVVVAAAPGPNVPMAPPAAKPAPKAPPAKPPPAAAAPSRGTGTSLASVLSRVRDDVQREKRYGSPDGDPAGDSDTASEGDRYLALVQRALKASYRIPATISERDRLHLKGTIVVYIEGDGRIARWRIEKPSGNGAFDDALERTLRETRLPPPPDAMRERYRSIGVQVLFQI